MYMILWYFYMMSTHSIFCFGVSILDSKCMCCLRVVRGCLTVLKVLHATLQVQFFFPMFNPLSNRLIHVFADSVWMMKPWYGKQFSMTLWRQLTHRPPSAIWKMEYTLGPVMPCFMGCLCIPKSATSKKRAMIWTYWDCFYKLKTSQNISWNGRIHSFQMVSKGVRGCVRTAWSDTWSKLLPLGSIRALPKRFIPSFCLNTGSQQAG